MAQIMNDEQRAKALEGYNPQEHLISVGTNKDRTPVLYYPAAWRLYELRLRHPHFTLEAEIVHMNEENGTVIVKAIGYDGLDYASSNLKGTAMKQGKIADLDKVETKAKSRVARDCGIGTEYALDMTPDETDAQHTSPVDRSQAPSNGNGQRASASPVPQEKATPAPLQAGLPGMVNENQVGSIRNLCRLLGKAEPSNFATMTFDEAKELMGQLGIELRNRPANKKAS